MKIVVLLLLLISQAPLYAGAKIVFDTTVLDVGAVVKEQKSSIVAQFHFTNSGNEDLVINQVTSGSPAVHAAFTTDVAPGSSGTVTATIDLRGYRSGSTLTVMKVLSNTEGDSTVRLGVTMRIHALVDIHDAYISLNASLQQKTRALTFGSKKKNLTVTQLFFEPQLTAEGTTGWRTGQPVPVEYIWTATDSTDTDGYRQFTCTLQTPRVSQSARGYFVFMTNHPEKPEVRVAGTLLK